MKPIYEEVKTGFERSIIAFRHDEIDFKTPWHIHEQHELTYIEESSGTKFVGDFVGPYMEGELVLIHSNLPHCWKNHSQQEGRSISTVVQWNKGTYSNVPELKLLFQLLSKATKGILFEKEQLHPILLNIKKLPSIEGHLLYSGLLSVLLQLSECSYMTLSEKNYVDFMPAELNNRMGKIHDFVESNYNRKIYLKELADIANLSEQSFSRFFTKMMGRSFFTFLNEYRINIACRMLIDTDWSVSRISYSSGYQSLPFFHTQFKKFKNESPSRYRKVYKNGKGV